MYGKVRFWPKGANFSNQFAQIYLNFNDDLILFNGYLSDSDISILNRLLAPYWSDIKVIQMKARDPRKSAQQEVDLWAKDRNITAYKMAQMYLNQINLEILTYEKNNNKSSDVNDDLEKEI